MSEKQTAKRSVKRQADVSPKKIVRKLRGKVLTRDAGIFKIMGIGESNEPGGFSWRKHELD